MQNSRKMKNFRKWVEKVEKDTWQAGIFCENLNGSMIELVVEEGETRQAACSKSENQLNKLILSMRDVLGNKYNE